MKTPIQEFYEFMNQNQYFIGNDLYKKYQALLEKEKKVIMDAYNSGQQIPPFDYAEKYFKETFNTEEK